MKWGLRARLTAALIGVTLLALGIATATFQLLAGSGFAQLAVGRAQAGFIQDVASYYRQAGTLDGLPAHLRPRGPAPPLSADAASQAQARGAPDSPSLPAAEGVGPPPLGIVPFVLVDTSRRVVTPAGEYRAGQSVPPEVVARGTPVRVNGQVIGTVLPVEVGGPYAAAEDLYVERTQEAFGIAAAAGILAAACVGFLIARGIARPVGRLTEAAAQVAREEAVAVPVQGSDELAALARAFNRMSAEVVQVNAARRQLVADVAHELRNPLATIAGYVEAMKDGELAPTPERLAAVHDQTRRLERIIEDLGIVSQADAGRLSVAAASVPVEDVLRATVDHFGARAEQLGVALQCRLEDGLGSVRGDLERLEQVMDRLVTNALSHTPPGGEVRLIGRCDGQSIALAVEDTGSGIPETDLPFVFDPLYRAGRQDRRDGDGSGLGLAVVKALVAAHGGTVDVESVPNTRTAFTLHLPRAAAVSAAGA